MIWSAIEMYHIWIVESVQEREFIVEVEFLHEQVILSASIGVLCGSKVHINLSLEDIQISRRHRFSLGPFCNKL